MREDKGKQEILFVIGNNVSWW